jgi:hypothetical protein
MADEDEYVYEDSLTLILCVGYEVIEGTQCTERWN